VAGPVLRLRRGGGPAVPPLRQPGHPGRRGRLHLRGPAGRPGMAPGAVRPSAADAPAPGGVAAPHRARIRPAGLGHPYRAPAGRIVRRGGCPADRGPGLPAGRRRPSPAAPGGHGHDRGHRRPGPGPNPLRPTGRDRAVRPVRRPADPARGLGAARSPGPDVHLRHRPARRPRPGDERDHDLPGRGPAALRAAGAEPPADPPVAGRARDRGRLLAVGGWTRPGPDHRPQRPRGFAGERRRPFGRALFEQLHRAPGRVHGRALVLGQKEHHPGQFPHRLAHR
jgi:hypothetical protein